MSDPIQKFFPFDEYRTNQRETIVKIAKAFKSGKKNIILEAPTGSGKSIIGVTIANIFNTSYMITAQKILQQQYLNDFPHLVDLKGRNAYPCWFLMDHMGSKKYHGCDKGQCVRRNKSFLKVCLNGNRCQYANQLEAATGSPHTLFNFSSFLFQREFAGRFTDERKLLIADESHGIEQQIMNFVETTIAEKDVGQKLPNFSSVEKYMAFFETVDLRGTLSKKIDDLTTELENLIGKPIDTAPKPTKFAAVGKTVIDMDEVYQGDDAADCEDQEHATDLLKDINTYRSALNRYNYLKSYSQEVRCVCEYNEKDKSVCIKPLYATYHTPRIFLNGGKHRLLMSATILNPKIFSESIGLNLSDTQYISVPHTFPVQNRLIHLDYAGPMDYKSRSKTLPKMINKIDKLMTKHKNEKGIIHCQSFKLMKEIADGVSIENRGRLLDQKMFKNKDELLLAHSVSSNTVIIAPAMHEGLDLKNDLSRFQLICKIPYPDSRDNKQLKIRSDESWGYYLWLVALKLVQSCGRSIRSETDYASTYILDASFDKFFNMADRERLLPDWFVESLVVD